VPSIEARNRLSMIPRVIRLRRFFDIVILAEVGTLFQHKLAFPDANCPIIAYFG
jgi:hypothetical protein